MRLTPALALLAAVLASSAVGALADPHHHGGHRHEHAPAHIHRRSCKLHHKRSDDAGSTPAPVPNPQPWVAPAGSGDDSGAEKPEKHKGKCALKNKHKKHDGGDQGSQGANRPPITGAPTFDGEGNGYQPPTDGGYAAGGQPGQGSGPVGYSNGGQPGDNTGGDNGSNPGSNPGAYPGANPGNTYDHNNGGSSGQPGDEGSQGHDPGQEPEGYGLPTPNGSDKQPVKGKVSGDKVHCKGIRGSTFLPSTGTFKPHQFSPDFIHHGPGTSFGGGNNFWQGGACMFDDLPHANLPSVAMDQTFFQDGLACGTCVEIASTSASLFSNDAKWTVETPKVGKLPPGKKTIAIVSDLCPGVDQCWSGLDMHPDAWNSVTGGANGSKLPINWKFVNCKEAFESSGSGGKNLEIHWRPGANAGFFEVQVRGNHEAVVRVEMKVPGRGWSVAKHVDNSWWKWDGGATNKIKEDTAVVFRITDWQGQTITSEVGTVMGHDLEFDANFDRIGSSGSEGEGYEA